MHCLTVREHPRSLAAHTMCPGFVLANAQLPEIRDPRAATPPALPDAHPNAAAYPLVQVAEEALDGHQTEIPDPALEVTAKFGASLCKRDTAVASGQFPDAGGELVEVLPGDAKLAAVALEDEAEKLDAVGATGATLLWIDHQLEFSRQVTLDRREDTLGRFPRFGEHEEVVRVTHKAVPARFQLFVEIVQQDIRQQGREDSSNKSAKFSLC